MKQNLLALLVLLLLVAVTAQFTRQGGKKHDQIALEKDMIASLELLWQQPGQSVEILDVENGLLGKVAVSMPPQSCGTWNYALLEFVAARHPAVKVDIFVSDRLSGLIIFPARMPGCSTPQSELLQRQVQAGLDAKGRDRAVALVDVRETAPVPVVPQPPVEMRIECQLGAAPDNSEQSVPYSRVNSSGKAYIPATPAPVPQIQIHACLVVLPEVSPEEVDQAVRSLNLNPERGDQIRVVRLPPL